MERGMSAGAGEIYAGHAKSLPITEMVPGFLRFQSAGEVEYMLHSKEEKTGISYPADPDDEGIISENLPRERRQPTKG